MESSPPTPPRVRSVLLFTTPSTSPSLLLFRPSPDSHLRITLEYSSCLTREAEETIALSVNWHRRYGRRGLHPTLRRAPTRTQPRRIARRFQPVTISSLRRSPGLPAGVLNPTTRSRRSIRKIGEGGRFGHALLQSLAFARSSLLLIDRHTLHPALHLFSASAT